VEIMTDAPERLSLSDLEAESGTMLPDKEVMSLLDLNVNVDLALDLAAPVDLAVAANANIAAPIEAAVSSNVLSVGSEAGAGAHQAVSLDQGISGSAIAHAPQTAGVDQTGGAAPGTTDPAHGPTDPAAPATAPAAAGTTEPTTAPAVTSGGALDGPLLNVNADINANAHLAAPVAGAVAANANVAAPIDASASANVASVDSTSTAVSDQTALVSQHLDGVTANAEAAQNASVQQ
jgi:hypothetical protein